MKERLQVMQARFGLLLSRWLGKIRETLRALHSVGVVVALLGTRRNRWAGRVALLTGLGGGGKVLHKHSLSGRVDVTSKVTSLCRGLLGWGSLHSYHFIGDVLLCFTGYKSVVLARSFSGV